MILVHTKFYAMGITSKQQSYKMQRLINLVKRKVNSTPCIYKFVAHIRERQIEGVYRKTVDYYANQKIQGTCKELLTSRLKERLQRLRHLEQPLNIFYVGTIYFQDSSGILQACEEIGNLSYFTREDGDYGQYSPIREFYVDFKEANGKRLWQLVSELEARNEVPHILIGQMWAGWIDGSVLSKIRKQFGTIVVNICMDDRHAYWGKMRLGDLTGTKGLIPHIDLAATAAPECVDWYLKEGCPAIFFPEASDPKIFYPMPDLPKIHDVCFVGKCYGIRREIIMSLRKAGVRVITYGHGWENGQIATSKVPKLFAQSKIVIGVGTISHCRNFFALKMRDFDGPMSGSLYLTQDNKDLHDLFEVGKEIVVYSSIDDCIEKVRYFLRHSEKREKIARCGLERVRQEHTWKKRFKYLIQFLLNEDQN